MVDQNQIFYKQLKTLLESKFDVDSSHINSSLNKDNKIFYNFLKKFINIYGNLSFYIVIYKRRIKKLLRKIKIFY